MDERIPETDAADRSLPSWAPEFLRQATIRGILILVAAALLISAITGITSKLHGFFGIIFTAFFASFAIEPGVNWFAKRGWRRGYATGLIFLFIALFAAGLVALVVPAIIAGTKQLIAAAPELIDRFVRLANRFGWHISAQNLTTQIQQHARELLTSAANVAGSLLGIAASFFGAVFRFATISLFTFYIVAEGPKLRRVICSGLPGKQQKRVLFVWNQAIEKTGGYFYSRLLLAVINGTGMYVTLRVFSVPFAAPLAIFEGVVAEFIPIVGTYIAGAPPTLVAFLYSGPAGIASLAYIIIYQQIENYLLSPRLTAKTMSLHPAMAFAAALIGGAIGGLLTAFLALPVAGVIQAAVGAWGKRYVVVDDELTSEAQVPPPKDDEPGVADVPVERPSEGDGPDG
jgi:predicted PurR-regulated permease PerM